jgi:hypothetical protein
MKHFLLVFFACQASLVLSQSKAVPEDPIVTDRPDFTESAVVVPFRWFQLETGFTYQNSRSGSVLGLPEALLRYGMCRRTELRLGLPSHGRFSSASLTTTGFSDTYVGVKHQIGPFSDGSDFALIPAVTLPSHDSPFSSGSLDPEIKICWARGIGSKWSLSVMSYGLWTTDASGRVLSFQQTASFGRELSERLGVFFEYAGTFTKRANEEHVAHVGFAYRPTPDQQFDIHGGITMNGDRSPFIAGGYSVRW